MPINFIGISTNSDGSSVVNPISCILYEKKELCLSGSCPYPLTHGRCSIRICHMNFLVLKE